MEKRVVVKVLCGQGQTVAKVAQAGKVDWSSMELLASLKVTIQADDEPGLYGVVRDLKGIPGVRSVVCVGRVRDVPLPGEDGAEIG